ASLYRVGGCPTFAYVYPGGAPQSASSGILTAPPLGQRLDSPLHAPPAAEGGRDERGASKRPYLGPRAQRETRGAWRGGGPARSDLGWEPAPVPGWVAPHVAAEFPGLAISSIVVDSRPARSPEPVRRRLRDLSDRFYGSHAVRLRERPIPWAYRAFYRQIGL